MNRLFVVFFLILAIFTFQFAFAGGDKVTIEGELVDTKCYSGMGAKGEDHQGCAVKCAESGIPLGVLDEDGQVHVVLTVTPAIAQYAGMMVKIEGKRPESNKNSIVPNKIWIKKNGKWEEGELPKTMM